MNAISRRALLGAGGALIIGFTTHDAAAQHAPDQAAGKPELRAASGRLGPHRAGRDDHRVHRQGPSSGRGSAPPCCRSRPNSSTVAPDRIALVTADTGRTPDEGYTAGSHSMQDSGTAIMNATAELRAILVQEAASRWNLDAGGLMTAEGRVHAPDGRSLGYGDLVGSLDPERLASPGVVLKDPASYTVMGHPVQRVDIPAKVTGGAAYVQDMRLPGMVHARAIRPPRYGATLASLDGAKIEAMPGVIKLVRDGSYLAVIAEGEWQAITAMRAVQNAAVWTGGQVMPDQAKIFDIIQSLPARDTVILDRKADAAAPVRTLRARYLRPYGMHGSIGPSCAVAHLADGKMTVWTHTQGVYPDRAALAELLQMPLETVRCIHTEGSGCYGHNGADDAAADAALLAQALPGRPVRVQWMREQENTWEPFTPAMVAEVQASLAADGSIVDWQYAMWSNTHNMRPGNGGRLMPSWARANPLVPSPPMPIPQPEGGGDRNGIPLYDLPTAHVVSHFVPEMPLRVSAMRGLGAYTNVFAIESFMDELAEAADIDRVAFRLKHLSDGRARDVVTRAASEFGWPQAATLPKGHGRGFAFARYKNLGAYAAVAVEIAVDRETGRIRVVRAHCAVDSGQIVSLDGIRNQIQGGLIQSASWTLYEAVTYGPGGITSRDWGSYPILRFDAVPEQVAVHVIDRPGQPFLGTGEAAQGPTAAAIANALSDAMGVRVRELPLGADRVKDAIGV